MFFIESNGVVHFYQSKNNNLFNSYEFSFNKKNDTITMKYQGQEKISIDLTGNLYSLDIYPIQPLNLTSSSDFEFPCDL